jgi:SRSO17 transposase
MGGMVQQWEQELQVLHRRIAPRFRRVEPRRRVLGYLRALLSTCERKNGWQVAELLGEKSPDGVQRLLNAAEWEADQVRDDLRAYVVAHLGNPEAVLVLDETGFVKKGTHSVGVHRQYSGTAGRIENCQVGVFLCYASQSGAAFIDRELYLPQDWSKDRPRCRAADVPEELPFATKPQLGQRMLERAFAAGVPRAWVVADTVYGGDRRLRMYLEARGQPFVLAIPSNEPLWWGGPEYYKASALAQQVVPEQWQRCSAGEGAKGPRLYDWALVELWRLQQTAEDLAWGHYLLVRRAVADPSDLAYYVVFARRQDLSLEAVVRVAGSRWQIEVAFEAAKGDCGLDEYEVRKWPAWHRHITLALLAHAFLVVVRHQEAQKGGASRISFR